MVVWSKGMLFTYNSYGIAQRPFRSYSYKNQSIMAIAHRLLRDVPADGEAILSQRSREGHGGPRPKKGIAPFDPSTDLLTFLKPHRTSFARFEQCQDRFSRRLQSRPQPRSSAVPRAQTAYLGGTSCSRRPSPLFAMHGG